MRYETIKYVYSMTAQVYVMILWINIKVWSDFNGHVISSFAVDCTELIKYRQFTRARDETVAYRYEYQISCHWLQVNFEIFFQDVYDNAKMIYFQKISKYYLLGNPLVL